MLLCMLSLREHSVSPAGELSEHQCPPRGNTCWGAKLGLSNPVCCRNGPGRQGQWLFSDRRGLVNKEWIQVEVFIHTSGLEHIHSSLTEARVCVCVFTHTGVLSLQTDIKTGKI